MYKINYIGDSLRKIRKESGQTLAEAAESLQIDRTHLNKIELGTYKPTMELLEEILAHFSVEGRIASQLRIMLRDMKGPQVERLVTDGNKEGKVEFMSKDAQLDKLSAPQIVLDPAKTPVLYTDSTFVSSSDFGLVLDVAQTISGSPQQNIVARIGMSFDHAKKLIEVVNDHLQKNER